MSIEQSCFLAMSLMKDSPWCRKDYIGKQIENADEVFSRLGRNSLVHFLHDNVGLTPKGLAFITILEEISNG